MDKQSRQIQVEDLDEAPLVEAYETGLEVGLDWSIKWAEFLYQTPEGEKVRRELKRDFNAWQKQELGVSSQEKLLSVREFLARLFPLDVAPARGKATKTKADLKKSGRHPKKAAPPKKVKPTRSPQVKNSAPSATSKKPARQAEKTPILTPKKSAAKVRKLDLQPQAPKTTSTTTKSSPVSKTKKPARRSSASRSNQTMKFKNIK